MASQPAPAARPEREEQAISFEVGDYRLTGTLSLPLAGGPHPAVALLHGAGPGVHDDYVAPIGEVFTQAGLAVLVWDRPGCGGSTGDWQRQNVDERA